MNRSGASRRDAIERTAGGIAEGICRDETAVRGTVSTAAFAANFATLALWAGLIALSGLWTAGCYDTPRPACGFTCGKDGACPDGYVCGESNRCRLPSVPESQCASAAPGMGADAMPVDAAPTQDAPPDAAIDAGIDAGLDAGIDAMPDSMPDGMVDAGTDAASADAPAADAGRDAAISAIR